MSIPNSEPYKRHWNYIRNSVKIVVDAYEGTVPFTVLGHRVVAVSYAFRTLPYRCTVCEMACSRR